MKNFPVAKPNARKDLPSVDELLRSTTGKQIISRAGEVQTVSLARQVIEGLRGTIATRPAESVSRTALTVEAEEALRALFDQQTSDGIRRVINATGVVIHTNLGRAPLSKAAIEALANEASGYCTLEYGLSEGKRARRGVRAERLLAEMTGAEDVLIVNNGAAAAFFVLNVFASGGEVVISRGELVEIGGDFRVPDLLERSGAVLREVGTTNRTKVADYEKAVNAGTRMLLRVHPSNYKITGFTAAATRQELASLARQHDLLFYEDLGSGALIDMAPFGMPDEPIVSSAIAAGADLVTFSGDKLLGGPQAGIIAGRGDLIKTMREHPLFRALRVGKLVYATLEATVEPYLRGTPETEIPVLQMIGAGDDELRSRSESLAAKTRAAGFEVELKSGRSAVGGGAAPDVEPLTSLITISHDDLTPEELERRLRSAATPVIARIANGKVTLDLRTVAASDEAELLSALASIAS